VHILKELGPESDGFGERGRFGRGLRPGLGLASTLYGNTGVRKADRNNKYSSGPVLGSCLFG
jgi:hypothetical protein